MRSAAHGAAACKIVMLDLSADWTRDSGTERDKRQSHSEDCYYHIYKAVLVLVLVLVDVRGQFVMPTKCYKFAELNLN